MKLYSYRGDGWWPKLSADGQYVAFGGGGIPSQGVPPMVYVAHVATGVITSLGQGRAIRWAGLRSVCWLVEDGPMRDVMWTATIDGPGVAVVMRVEDEDPALVAANDFAMGDGGHWASWLAHGKRLVIDGQVLPGEYTHGVEMNGRYLLTVRADGRFVVLLDGTEWRTYPLPARANSWTISREGYIGYGYYWPSRVIVPNGRDLHITAAHWGEESVPQIVHVGLTPWAWTHTVRRDGVSLMCGRPVPDRDVAPGEQPCIVIPDLPADSFDAVCVDDRWFVAGFSGTGDLAVHAVSLHQTREVVRDVSSPQPTPDPDPPVDEDDPVQLEPKHSALIDTFAKRFPPPGGNEDELRDHWTPKLVAQLVHSFPGEGWGWKSTSQGSRPSSDVIARRVGGKIWGYDLIIGAGTSGWKLATNAGPIDLSTQAFISVEAHDWLGVTPEPGEPEEPGEIGITPILVELNETQRIQLQTIAAIAGLADSIDGMRDSLADIRTVLEAMKAHDLVIADEIRKLAAVTIEGAEKVRAQIAGGVRLRL